MAASILVFSAYIGFDNMSNIAEDTKEPERTIPKGLVIAVLVTTFLYVLIGISAVVLFSELISRLLMLRWAESRKRLELDSHAEG